MRKTYIQDGHGSVTVLLENKDNKNSITDTYCYDAYGNLLQKTGDTLVSTEDGDRRIDEIQAGDYVWAYNTETGERELKKVLSTPVTETDILVHVGLSDGTEIQTTMLHPFYVKTEDGGEWVAASNLTKGDEVLTEDGRVVYVETVQVEKLDKKIKVYNLKIEDLHTYFVAGGVLVHNKCIGENGTQTSSTTTGQNGKIERIDVENPSPGKRNGNIHYHEPNNRKWYYDFGLDKFIDEKTGELALKKFRRCYKNHG
ncbi:MAG: hypothetical protein II838_07620 [Lachnospiraceae bacterium]|nr:hypothetical protein [Lachnospiraceae bacterium]